MAGMFLKSAVPALSLLLAFSSSATALPSPKNMLGLIARQNTCASHGGRATFYCSGTDPNQITACNNKYDPNAPGVAISTMLLADYNAVQPYCGQSVSIYNSATGVQAVVPIVDLCATCTEKYQIDVSVQTLKDLGGTPDCAAATGEIPDVSWQLESFDTPGFTCF